jgi:hypothetical protein
VPKDPFCEMELSFSDDADLSFSDDVDEAQLHIASTDKKTQKIVRIRRNLRVRNLGNEVSRLAERACSGLRWTSVCIWKMFLTQSSFPRGDRGIAPP